MILCLDPGVKNFGWSLVSLEGELIEVGMLDTHINNLKDRIIFNSQVSDFIKEFKIFREFDFKYIIYERFMLRFRTYGNTGEIVNMLLGIIFRHFRKKEVVSITAAAWKNFFKQNVLVMENEYLPIHILDSISMGLYFLTKEDRIDINYIKWFSEGLKNADFNGWV